MQQRPKLVTVSYCVQLSPVAYRGGFLKPPLEILKALQNCAKLNPILKDFGGLRNFGGGGLNPPQPLLITPLINDK